MISHMMATATVVGLSAGKRVLSSSFFYSDLSDKFSFVNDIGLAQQYATSMKNTINAKKSSARYNSSFPSNRHNQSIKALKEHVDTASTREAWFQTLDHLEDENVDPEYSVEALLLLQKSMLEKQWSLNFEEIMFSGVRKRKTYKIPVTSSGVSARQRRMNTRRRDVCQNSSAVQPNVGKQLRSIISPKLLQNRTRGYAKGVASEELLSHKEVVRLSKKIKTGLSLQEHKSRLMESLGFEPSDEQLAISLKISRAELKSRLVEYSLARERLAMSNVRLVMSVAQRYVNMGAEMGDLVQGGLIGLLRGIEKFDSSKGFKMSTYVYWWIRQGVSRVLVENSRTLRLPAHLHERLSLIRNAKLRLQDQGIAPTIDKIAESLKISEKKVTNATEAVSKVFSLDRAAFPSVDGHPGASLHSYIADNRPENNPWKGVDDWALKEEVNNLINTTLGVGERDIVRLYYGLDHECLTWEDISKRIGLSRERVRQVGLVAVEKLKHAAMKRNLEAMLVKQ